MVNLPPDDNLLECLTADVIHMAWSILGGFSWSNLPQLGDALEEAGYNNQDVLDRLHFNGTSDLSLFLPLGMILKATKKPAILTKDQPKEKDDGLPEVRD